MARLDRIIKAFNDYDDLVDELALRNSDSSQINAQKKLREEVKFLIAELKRYGCRRDEKYLKMGYYAHPKND